MKRFLTILSIIFLISVTSSARALYWNYSASCLTGGTTDCLDAINGQILQDKDFARVTTATSDYIYFLDADSGAAESSPDIISPDTNAGDKRWILLGRVTKVSTADVSSPPTDAELDSAFGTPATVGKGFVGIVDDDGAGTTAYLVFSDGTNWWYLSFTKAS